MGPIARVLWGCLPELLHVGAVLVIVALMAAIMGNSLFGDRAASFSTLAGALPVDKGVIQGVAADTWWTHLTVTTWKHVHGPVELR